jgi:hypothetical protein
MLIDAGIAGYIKQKIRKSKWSNKIELAKLICEITLEIPKYMFRNWYLHCLEGEIRCMKFKPAIDITKK